MTENTESPADVAQDGAVVVSIPVPVLTKARSAPELSAMSNGSAPSAHSNSKNGVINTEICSPDIEETHEVKWLLLFYLLF